MIERYIVIAYLAACVLIGVVAFAVAETGVAGPVWVPRE